MNTDFYILYMHFLTRRAVSALWRDEVDHTDLSYDGDKVLNKHYSAGQWTKTVGTEACPADTECVDCVVQSHLEVAATPRTIVNQKSIVFRPHNISSAGQ